MKLNISFISFVVWMSISPIRAIAKDEPVADAARMQMNMKQSSSSDCSSMEVWEISMGMCMPLSMTGMPMRMFMLHGNAFAVETTESGPQGRTDYGGPNMVMTDIGTSVGDSQYINLDFMGTLERWTQPYAGYPELLQIGESNSQGVPFLDAQHPHSSPIMGLTLSDTIRFSEESKNNVKIFFAPRGESTDGPVAFMHRPTGMVNPDAPLGHHVGQDVGHISSTVLGASLLLGDTRIEASTFNGTEPQPDSVDLPMGQLNSMAFRIIKDFSPSFTAMISYADARNSEPNIPDVYRYSGSIYTTFNVGNEWKFQNAFIIGSTTNYDFASELTSFCEEYLLRKDKLSFWGRIEVLQRTAAELQIATASSQNDGEWVNALTIGHTRSLIRWSDSEFGIGGSLTLDILPPDFSSAYGGSTPITGRVFVQYSGSKMWEF
jgi:hypothetical protein